MTGGGRGAGEAIARSLAEAGASVLVAARTADQVQRVADEIEQHQGRAFAATCDVADEASVRALAETAVRTLGGVDILVNNAGVALAAAIHKTRLEDWERVFAVNVKAIYLSTLEVVPIFRRQGGRAIINTASTAGLRPRPGLAWYNASKGAVIAFTRSLAIELAGTGIRVNAIGPGLIEVPRYFDDPAYTTEIGASRVPVGRVGLPADIAEAVAFLVSDGAGFITGQTLFVDGGTTARMGLFQMR